MVSSVSVIALAHAWTAAVGYALAAASMAYLLIAWFAVRVRLRSAPFTLRHAPPVSLLKPLCGVEMETYGCLRSFCTQAYPEFQVVFGVASQLDPAVAVVHRLQREFPQRDLGLVIDARLHGRSRKVSNLINMMSLARHEFLVVSDSDVRVPGDYLARVVAPLLDAGVGIVTCAYRGRSRAGLWSLLGSLFINEWFMPSVRVAALGGSRSFAFGATIAIRRQVLAGIGGFKAIANQLADDYRLGQLTRDLGLRTVLSDVVVETCVVERSLTELVRHELRWLRTIRTLRPWGYGFSFVTFGLPVTLLGTLLAGGAALQPLVLPLRDLLSLGLWSWSFTTRRVRWRDDHYHVTRDGSVLPVVRV